ncbi:hypothetical protein ENBRE01_1094 [Enteropsectra breve]|nr:hypothetical protein ENBRE01_1094 [Enteropsectra breve]
MDIKSNSEINEENTNDDNTNDEGNLAHTEHFEEELKLLKFSKNEIKILTKDHEDQTIGGKRVYTERKLVDGLMQEYIYPVKFVKLIKNKKSTENSSEGNGESSGSTGNDNLKNDSVNKKKGRAGESKNNTVAKMKKQNKINTILIDLNSGEKEVSVKKETKKAVAPSEGAKKRGRPKKYAPGTEPYKVKKAKTEDNKENVVNDLTEFAAAEEIDKITVE